MLSAAKHLFLRDSSVVFNDLRMTPDDSTFPCLAIPFRLVLFWFSPVLVLSRVIGLRLSVLAAWTNDHGAFVGESTAKPVEATRFSGGFNARK